MEVFEAIERGGSIRKYKDEPIPEDVMNRLLEAARLAPSSSNTQSWKFKVITDLETRKKLKELALGQKFVEEASAVIACCVDFNAFGERGKEVLKLVISGAVRPTVSQIMQTVRRGKGSGTDTTRRCERHHKRVHRDGAHRARGDGARPWHLLGARVRRGRGGETPRPARRREHRLPDACRVSRAGPTATPARIT